MRQVRPRTAIPVYLTLVYSHTVCICSLLLHVLRPSWSVYVCVLHIQVGCTKTAKLISTILGAGSCEPNQPCIRQTSRYPHGKWHLKRENIPDTPCTTDSSSLGTHCHLGPDATNATHQGTQTKPLDTFRLTSQDLQSHSVYCTSSWVSCAMPSVL